MSRALNWEAVSKADISSNQAAILEHMLNNEPPAQDDSPGGWSPNMLAKALNQPLGRVSYHVRRLIVKGGLTLVGTQPRRGALEHYYNVTEDVLNPEE